MCCIAKISSTKGFTKILYSCLSSFQQGQRKESLSDTFWLMTFFESSSLIGSQMLANWLAGSNVEKGMASASTLSIILAVIGIIAVTRCWNGTMQTLSLKDYRMAFYTYVLSGESLMFVTFAFFYFKEQTFCYQTFLE